MNAPDDLLKSAFERRLLDLRIVVEGVDPDHFGALLQGIRKSSRLYLGGAGRSGAVMEAFGSRLARSGRVVHQVFDRIAPPIARGDFLLVGSGSGGTATLVAAVERARSIGAGIGLVTANALSPLGRLADSRLVLPPILPPEGGDRETLLAPMQVLFEQALLLTLDVLADRLEVSAESSQ